jgi:hypothetical protein
MSRVMAKFAKDHPDAKKIAVLQDVKMVTRSSKAEHAAFWRCPVYLRGG